jgi:hypothetical protein
MDTTIFVQNGVQIVFVIFLDLFDVTGDPLEVTDYIEPTTPSKEG